MSEADIGIIGGGLAGSLAAAMLGKAGISTVLIDLHQPYPPDFRCEKIDTQQLRLLAKTGLADGILKSATPMREVWLARYGRVIAKRPSEEAGFLYQDFVNATRAEISADTLFVRGRVSSLSTSDQRQIVQISNGESYSVRLAVVATGLNNNVRQQLQVTREERSRCHSVSIGFDLRPKESGSFAFPALTYFAESPQSRVGYITLFPIGSTMRANLFVYREMHDPWLQALREDLPATLFAAMPRLRKQLGDFEVTSGIEMRPVDLYVTQGHRQPGVVLVGDAFCTSCPAAGTGITKVLTDVERLCNVYIPQWLATDGMGVEKIGAYYEDRKKTACDAMSSHRAYYMRSLAIDRRLRWRVRRLGWFSIKMAGTALRGLGEQLALRSPPASYPASSEQQPSPFAPAKAGRQGRRPEINN